MTFDKKTLIIIVSSVAGVILLWGIISFAAHGRYERNDFERNFGNPWCHNDSMKGNQAHLMSGIENIITTKDYAAFQKLFIGTRTIQTVNTPEKFAIRVELQTAIEKAQTLQTQLWSGDNNSICPMMFGNQQAGKEGRRTMGREHIGKKWWMLGCY